MEEKTLLVWRAEQLPGLGEVAEAFGAALVPVTLQEAGGTPEALIKGTAGPAPASGALPETPALVMAGFGDELDALLAALHKAGLDIPLKAVLTPANRTWSFAALLQELAREREELRLCFAKKRAEQGGRKA